MLKERKNKIIIIKNYLKKKVSCWLQTGQASFAGLFGCSRLRGLNLALLSSDQHSASLQSSSPEAPPPSVVVHTLPSACNVVSFPSEVCTLPSALDLGSMPPTPPRERLAAEGRRGWSCCCRRTPQSAPECLSLSLSFDYFFMRKSSCSIPPVHAWKGLCSHTAHLSS